MAAEARGIHRARLIVWQDFQTLIMSKATDSVMALRGVKQWIRVDGLQIYVTEAKRRGLSWCS